MIFRGLNEKCKSQRFHGTISQNNYQKYSKVPNKVQFDVINFIPVKNEGNIFFRDLRE